MASVLPLPPGVTRRAGVPAGIAVGKPGRSIEIASAAGYSPAAVRTAASWLDASRVSAEYAAIAHAPAAPDAVVVATARHSGAPPLPEVAAIGNVPLSDGSVLFGHDSGHVVHDLSDNTRTQAVLEFHGYGLCVVDIVGHDNIELWVCEPGSKVSVQYGPTNVTVYNLDDARSPLTVLTAYDPRRTVFSPKLSAVAGPVFAARYVPDREATLTLNSAYVNRAAGDGGVRIAPPSDAERTVRIPLRPQLELGSFLFSEIFNNPDVVRAFVRLNVRVLPAPGGVELGPAPGEKADLRDRRPLVQSAAPGRPLHKRLYG